jgi:ELWxxDGT repeat protein
LFKAGVRSSVSLALSLSRLSVSLGLPLLGLAAPALGQTATLVREINPEQHAVGAAPEGFFSFQGKVWFSAFEPSSGQELWVTDGQGTGTRIFADLCPGECSSAPEILGATRSLLFGLARELDESGSSRTYLWRSDGTVEGTFLLPEASRRISVSDPHPSILPPNAVLNGEAVYFAGCAEEDGCELWTSDGTPEGTRKVKEISGGSFGGDIRQLTAAGSRVFFTVAGELWATDGTPEGTRLLKELSGDWARHLTALGNRVLFLAPLAGEELWVSDGTPGGTRAITDFAAPSPFEQTRFLKRLGNKVYFVADDVVHGAELWATDGTATGTVRVTSFGFHDPFQADFGFYPPSLESLGERIVFWATDGLSGFKPWTTTGSPESTAPACASCSFSETFAITPLLRLGGQLFFTAEDEEHRRGLWKTDGTPRGTALVTELCRFDCPGLEPGETELQQAGPWIFFQRPRGPSSSSSSLWRTDGTREGSRLFADVDPNDLVQVVALGGGRFLFTGESQGSRERDLWAGDGTPEGSRRLTGFGRDEGSSFLRELVTAGNQVYFTACDEREARRVWRSDGTAAGTGAIAGSPVLSCFGDRATLALAGGKVFYFAEEFFPSRGRRLWRILDDGQILPLTDAALDSFSPAVAFKGQLFFAVGRSEIWKSDGTVQGTSRAIEMSGDVRTVAYLTGVGSELWFITEKTAGSPGLWRTDGTQAGTRHVTDLRGSSFFERDPELTRLGASVYFLAPGPSSAAFQLWKTDGTTAGTVPVREIHPEDFSVAQPAELTPFQGALYFFANLSATRHGLWRTDGTAAGTVVLREFVVPSQSALNVDRISRTGLTVLGSRLVFAADDGVHGIEPWTSDGTAEGTRMVRDVLPGSAGSRPGGFREAAGRLYFSATDGLHGFELWRTDGTAAGTRLVQDLAPEAASSHPGGLTPLEDRLLFSANDGLAGEELWVLPLGGPACQPSPTALCLNGGRFKVEVSWSIEGATGSGQAVPLTGDTGYFWFFSPGNVEVVLKVLDGQGVNGHHWVFYGALSNVEYLITVTDTQTGVARRYFNPSGVLASVGDTTGFGPQGAHPAKALAVAQAGPPPLVSERIDLAAATGACVPSATRLCLNGGRFAAEISWKDFSGNTGTGTAVGLTGDTGYFWFFNAANVEVVLKVLDGQAVNGRHWVFYGALSSVEYTLTVTDTATGQVKTYRNPSGRLGSVADTGAF